MSWPVIFQLTQVGRGKRLICFAGGSFQLGARRALQHSVRGQKLQWATPATTSKDVPYRKADTPQQTHTHASHKHTALPGKHIHIFMRSPKRCSEGHRQEGEAVIWSTKKCVYNNCERGKELWGSWAVFSFHYPAACSNMWIQDIEWKPKCLQRFEENLKVFWLFTFAFLLLLNVLPVCWRDALVWGR